MTRKIKRTLLVGLALASFGALGCKPIPNAESSHTLQVGPTEQRDVVWVRKGDDVYRCAPIGDAPICKLAALPKR
jgi:hypothetical protein